jgi:hypothetical protein
LRSLEIPTSRLPSAGAVRILDGGIRSSIAETGTALARETETMITTTLGLALIVAQSAAGWHGHDDRATASCDVCGMERSSVVSEIVRLQKSPNWRAREDAARDLRKVDWRYHPEVLGALAYSLLHDGEEEVREEAAQSLTRMQACAPVVHEALTRAAACDPDGATRRQARRGLRNLARRCEAPCTVCGTAVVSTRVIGPAPGAPVLGPLDVAPRLSPAPVEPAVAPSPPAPIDSSVSPPAPTELVPLPPPADELKPAGGGLTPQGESATRSGSTRTAARPVVARPRVVTLLPRFLRPRSDER